MLPYGRQDIDDDDIAAVVAALRSDRLTTGPAVEAFERSFAERVDAPHAIACSSGTAALHLAALALGLGPGDHVIVPAITFLATANAARFVGAEVVFADVDPDTGLMRAEDLDAALAAAGDRTVRAVFPVHLAGQPADPANIKARADAARIVVVEDACHAIGTRYAEGNTDYAVGACRHSAMAAFSFHPVKTIACGEGGMVTTRDAALAESLRRMRNHGMVRDADAVQRRDMAFDAGGAPNPWYYEMPEIGFNYRLSDIHAALGLSQMGKLERFVARRAALVDRYDRLIAPLAPAVRPVARTAAARVGWHLYPVLIDFDAIGRTRAGAMAGLRARGVNTQVHYIPVAWQPYYRERYGDADLPGAWRYYERTLSLPLFPAMTDEDVDRVVEALSATCC
jgi:UDP-4-amino-4,6-dideoxy-N-acetyl-beta-L-altrosamine transaminase